MNTSKKSAYDYWPALVRLTDNVFPDSVPVSVPFQDWLGFFISSFIIPDLRSTKKCEIKRWKSVKLDAQANHPQTGILNQEMKQCKTGCSSQPLLQCIHFHTLMDLLINTLTISANRVDLKSGILKPSKTWMIYKVRTPTQVKSDCVLNRVYWIYIRFKYCCIGVNINWMQVHTEFECKSVQGLNTTHIRSILDTQYKCLGPVSIASTEYNPIESENGSIFIFIAGLFWDSELTRSYIATIRMALKSCICPYFPPWKFPRSYIT